MHKAKIARTNYPGGYLGRLNFNMVYLYKFLKQNLTMDGSISK